MSLDYNMYTTSEDPPYTQRAKSRSPQAIPKNWQVNGGRVAASA
jgi:hypothetical protein